MEVRVISAGRKGSSAQIVLHSKDEKGRKSSRTLHLLRQQKTKVFTDKQSRIYTLAV